MSRIFKEKARPIPISQEQVWKAYRRVKSNKGSAGIDGISLQKYEEKLEDNLYKLWNRLSSGSYFPPALKEVEIPKSNGKKRKLGIPTVGDRVGQQVIKDLLEPRLEKVFDDSSYGYRPLKSAHQALAAVRNNVRNYAWVIDLDITVFFDNVDHDKLLLALDQHVEEGWIKMYIKRWLTAPIKKANGELEEKHGKGTPQGGVVSPLLANLYLHYTFDKWMKKTNPHLAFVRYADDIIIHCHIERQANEAFESIQNRLEECGLSTSPEKTSIVYCKDYRRELKEKKVKFDFLGFSFCPRSVKSKGGRMFLGYGSKISKKSYSKLVKEIRDTNFHRWSDGSLQQIANLLNPKIRGWIQYYDRFCYRTLSNVFHRLHNRLMKWVLNKYKRFKGSRKLAFQYLREIYKSYPTLFYHWQIGYHFV